MPTDREREEQARSGSLVSRVMFFNVQGPVSNADRMTCVRLLAQEVIPAIRDYAKEIDLPDPYERTPGAVQVHAETTRVPVVDREAFAALGLD